LVKERILIGHSSGGSMVFGILHKLSPKNKINLSQEFKQFPELLKVIKKCPR